MLPIGVNKIYRNKLIEHLLSKRIFVTVNFRSITELFYYKKKYPKTTCPVSEKGGKEQISLPFHNKITEKEIKTVCLEIKKFFKKN